CPRVFVTDPPGTAVYPLSLRDALPISRCQRGARAAARAAGGAGQVPRIARRREGVVHARRAESELVHGQLAQQHGAGLARVRFRSEEHTSELQSQSNLVCRLLLEKKKK